MDNADWPKGQGQGQEPLQSSQSDNKEKDPDPLSEQPQRSSATTTPTSPISSTPATPPWNNSVHNYNTIPDSTNQPASPTITFNRSLSTDNSTTITATTAINASNCNNNNNNNNTDTSHNNSYGSSSERSSSPRSSISPGSGLAARLSSEYYRSKIFGSSPPIDSRQQPTINSSTAPPSGGFTSFQSFFPQPTPPPSDERGMSFEQMLMSEQLSPRAVASSPPFSPVREPEPMSPRSNKAIRTMSTDIPPLNGHINNNDIPMNGQVLSQDLQHPGAESGVTGHGTDHEDGYLHQEMPIRNYNIFPGRNVFFCGGRIMTSRDFPAFLMAIMLLCIPTGLFHGFTSPYLWHRLSPAAPIIHAYLFIVALSSMLKTSWTDPGVIPRGIDSDPPMDAPLELESGSASYYPPRGLPRMKEIQVGMYTLRLKYCDTCKIYRPPRCSHCRQCDNCVEDEDHHCVWLNNCIGRRNYRYFLIFVTTASFFALYTSALCLTHLLLLYHDRQDVVGDNVSFQKDALGKAPVSALVMVFSFVMGLAVGALATYHFWLATKNRTTHEQLSASMMRPHQVDNPFDQGSVLANCFAVLCRPPTRSYIRRRDYTTSTIPA